MDGEGKRLSSTHDAGKRRRQRQRRRARRLHAAVHGTFRGERLARRVGGVGALAKTCISAIATKNSPADPMKAVHIFPWALSALLTPMLIAPASAQPPQVKVDSKTPIIEPLPR